MATTPADLSVARSPELRLIHGGVEVNLPAAERAVAGVRP